jgi:hypothetical protein
VPKGVGVRLPPGAPFYNILKLLNKTLSNVGYMKHLLSLLLILSVQNAFAGFYGEVDYSVLYDAKSEYTTNTGERVSFAGKADARYLGLGFRYVFEDVLTENLNIEPLGKIFLPAKDRDLNKLTIFEVGSSISYSLGQHQPFLSLMMIMANDSDDSASSLTYTYGVGYQVGYRYNLNEDHMIYLTQSWKILNSNNSAGGVNDQETLVSMIALGYGYRFF